ncbi:MAG: VIT family protein [Xanthobacter sp.]
MTSARGHTEQHMVERIGWLRAAVLGANDGIISTASLMVGVASAADSAEQVLIAGFAGLVAGAMSMAAGEFVSVSSQADTERADIAREKDELAQDPEYETRELTDIYVGRGLSRDLAEKVARQLMEKNALEAHARDELGISPEIMARPIQASIASALSFTVGAIFPVLAAAFVPHDIQAPAIVVITLLLLGVLGALGAVAGGAAIPKAVMRVVFWGAVAMGVTGGIGALVGTAV